MRRKGPVGRANQSPADKKQKQNLAGSLVVFSCPLDLAQSLCFCLFSRVSLSLSVRVCMCACNLSLLLCQARVRTKTRLGLWLGLQVGWGREPKASKMHIFNLRRGHGRGTVGDGRVAHGEWQQFLCSCRGGARDPQTGAGHQRVCESGSQSASRDHASTYQYWSAPSPMCYSCVRAATPGRKRMLPMCSRAVPAPSCPSTWPST